MNYIKTLYYDEKNGKIKEKSGGNGYGKYTIKQKTVYKL